MTFIRRSYLAIPVVVLALALSACEAPLEPEEDYNLYEGLEAVEGTANTSVTISQGEAVGRDAWFEFEIGNIAQNDWISAGTHDGWCIEWTKPIAQQGDRHDNLQIYSTYGAEQYKPLNHFLNVKADLQAEDSDIDFREVQAIIWSVVQGPEFDLNTLSVEDLPARLKKDGEPNFSVEKVISIVDQVRADASSYEYTSDKKVALFMQTGSEQQDVMVPSEPPEENSVSHGYLEGVTPENIHPDSAARTYPVVQANWEGPGGDKRWLGRNLGATRAPVTVDDIHPESAGWYFQFNHAQGIYPGVENDEKVNQHNPGPVTGPQNPELDSDWVETDPCRALLEENWRLPTAAEWEAVADAGAEEELNLHFSGYILGTLSFLTEMGSSGVYWSSTQHSSANRGISFLFSDGSTISDAVSLMWDGIPVRCIED